jgi:hypothetical protein
MADFTPSCMKRSIINSAAECTTSPANADATGDLATNPMRTIEHAQVFWNLHGDFLSHSCGCRETGQVFGQQNFLPCLGIDKYCPCSTYTGAGPAIHTARLLDATNAYVDS